MIDVLLLTVALHNPKPIVPGTPRAVWCYAFHQAPAIWGDLGPYMRRWCRP